MILLLSSPQKIRLLYQVSGYTWKRKGGLSVIHWLFILIHSLSLRIFITAQHSSYPTQLKIESISMDGPSIQSNSMRSQFQAKNRNVVVLQSVSPLVAIFNYFCLQVSLEKATEKMLERKQLFRSDLKHTVIVVVSSFQWTYRMPFSVDNKVWDNEGKIRIVNFHICKLSGMIIN